MSHPIRPLSSLQSAVFLINSRSQLVSSTSRGLRSKSFTLAGVPSPEVTVPFCLVPSPEFSHTPWYSLPDHLCRFWVRSHHNLTLRGFSWKYGIDYFSSVEPRHQFSVLSVRICLNTQPTTLNADNQRRASLAFSVTPSQL